MKEIIQTICDDLVADYKQDKNVLGIMLTGSVAQGASDEHSDLDIYILLDNSNEFSRINFVKNGILVDIIFNTMKEAMSYLKGDEYGVWRNTSHMLAYGKILYQKKDELDIIQSLVNKNLGLKTKYKESEILMHKYSIDDFMRKVKRDVKNDDYFSFGIDCQFLVNNIIELFLKLKGEFLQQPNKMFKIIKGLDEKFANILVDFYSKNNFQEREAILVKLAEYIYSISGGPLPQEWSIKTDSAVLNNR